MYYYDIAKSQGVKDVSDAKDVYSYREQVNNWSSGANDNILLNNRAEILNSFESIGTYRYDTEEEQKQAQETKINTLMENTKMVAQTGVINTEVEYDSTRTEGQGNENKLLYKIEDIDLGLQERPEAQLKLNKQIENFKLTLADGSPLFDTTQSVHNLYFAKHNGHTAKYEGFRLTGYELGKNSKELPELLQAYMDEELIAGASIEARYGLAVENVGEVDYLDKQFYYTGKTAHPDDAAYVSKTNAKSVLDYVSNLSKYASHQEEGSDWKIVTASEIIKSRMKDSNNELIIDDTKIDEDLVNRKYFETVSTYNTLITTDKLSEDLLPSIFEKGNSSKSTKLVLSVSLSNSTDEDYIYNNLAEITSVSNTQGRRMIFSVVGNQEMSDQSLGNDASTDVYTTLDLVTPAEMDADSAQKIVILPPQGGNKNFLPIIFTGLAIALIFGVSIIIIKKKI